jgi:multiple sugar transport system permease protein
VVGVLYALPLVWMASTSIKPEREALSDSVGLLPEVPGDGAYTARLARQVADNYTAVINAPSADFQLYIRNSLLVALLSVTGMTVSSAVVAYGFARIRWRGRDTVFLGVLATMMIPFTVLMAPQFLLFKHLGWIGSFKPLWVPCWFGGGFSIFLLRQFYLGIPRELDEAARIDGCGHAGTFWHVVLPLARPALVVVALLQFIATWNDFTGPLVFLNHPSQYTAGLGLQMYQTAHGGTPWNLIMAASVIVIAPVMVVFLFAQGALIKGVATQGLKE